MEIEVGSSRKKAKQFQIQKFKVKPTAIPSSKEIQEYILVTSSPVEMLAQESHSSYTITKV